MNPRPTGPIGELVTWLVDRTLRPIGERAGPRGGIWFGFVAGFALLAAGATWFWWWDWLHGAIIFCGGLVTLAIATGRLLSSCRVRPRRDADAFLNEIRAAKPPVKVCLSCRTLLPEADGRWCSTCRGPGDLFVVRGPDDLRMIVATLEPRAD